MELIDFNKYINFTAIDFETANPSPTSICQIGLVRVEQGEVVHTINQLIQPPDNLYNYYNTRIHGIKAHQTVNAPFFHEVWQEIEPFIVNQHVVAHNVQFDSTCLRKTMDLYELPRAYYTKHCTVKIYKRGLAYLCEQYEIELKHHDALSDAMACATLFQRYLVASSTNDFVL